MAAVDMPIYEAEDSAASGSNQSLPVHRLRFVDWSPSTVTALSVSPTTSGATRGILAIGRQNGNIDLCTWVGPRPAQTFEFSDRSFRSDAAGWVVHTTLPGHINSKIEQLCFANPPAENDGGVHKLRLFSISGGSVVTEHFIPIQLAKLGARSSTDSDQDAAPSSRPGNLSALFGKKSSSDVDTHYPGEIRTLPSLGGAIWSMAASATAKYLAIGCEDGQVRIIDLENDRFEHLASTSGQERMIVPRFAKAKGRIISLCWGPPIKVSDAKATKPKTKSSSGDGDDSDDSDSESGSDSDSDSDDDDDQETSQWYESFLVGGLGVSSAVVWDPTNGNVASKLSLQKNRSESTIVWSVATFPDGTIATGDSTGRVTFFDPRTRTAISGATFRAHASASDVLALVVGPDGRTLYSAGVDQKVAEYTKVDTSNGRGQWVHIASRRLHAHDIRALALDPPYSPMASARARIEERRESALERLPILISGGVDFNLILTPASSPSSVTLAQTATSLSAVPKSRTKSTLASLTADEQKQAAINPISSNPLTTFADTTQRRVPFVPTASRSGLVGGGCVAALCPNKGWIVLRREQSIGVWDLGSKDALLEAARASQAGEPMEQPQWYKLLEMQVRVDSNLVAVTVSADGRYLAYSDLYETKLFELKERTLARGLREVEPKKVKSFGRVFGGDERIAPSASALRFSPDSGRLVVCSLTGAYVHVVELPSESNDDSCRLLRSFGHHRRQISSVSTEQQRQIAGRSGGANGSNGQTATGESSGNARQSDRVERTTSTVIQHAEISSDGAWLSTISSDLQHHVFSLDSLTFGRTLPSPHSLPSGSVFHPSTSAQFSSMLTLVFSDNKVEFWDVDSGKELVEISDANVDDTASSTDTTPRKKGSAGQRRPTNDSAKSQLVSHLSQMKRQIQMRLGSVRDFAISAVWLGASSQNIQDQTLLVYGATWICTARIAQLATMDAAYRDEEGDVNMNGLAPTQRSDRPEESTSTSIRIRTTFKYQPILMLAPLTVSDSSEHLVIVERPYFELASTLPPAFFRGARYGS
ncbi:WD40 repeat-like protein [Testicularia cyperi]|uniref:WD40 repeat-like protein n=1 Tax=Testicularia cyperi TaxID=1882483 RepID=A0A317XY04_9BASI|nr:WD40 repeat-like protein [Testicularia cyperi]